MEGEINEVKLRRRREGSERRVWNRLRGGRKAGESEEEGQKGRKKERNECVFSFFLFFVC